MRWNVADHEVFAAEVGDVGRGLHMAVVVVVIGEGALPQPGLRPRRAIPPPAEEFVERHHHHGLTSDGSSLPSARSNRSSKRSLTI